MSTLTKQPRPFAIGTGFLAAISLASCSPAAAPSVPSATCGLSPEQIGAYVQLSPGSFIKGADPIYPEEGTTLRLNVDSFWIQIHEVTTAQFASFVDDTGYVTEAEQGIAAKREGAGSAVFRHPSSDDQAAPTWTLAADATWRSGMDRPNAPVVHLTKTDAEAYAAWAGGRLPSEIEWEYAAQMGLPEPDDQTSGAYSDNGPRANTWQGIFPIADTGEDGFQGVAEVGCFEADTLGLYDMIGNVWEWTDTPFGAGTHTIKGGSFLCADNFCRRYRPAARQPQETDFSSNHIGFRIVRDAPPGA